MYFFYTRSVLPRERKEKIKGNEHKRDKYVKEKGGGEEDIRKKRKDGRKKTIK